MSFEADNIEHEVTIEDILLEILKQLKTQTLILEEISGIKIKEHDTDGQ